jgi:hypothetical protein
MPWIIITQRFMARHDLAVGEWGVEIFSARATCGKCGPKRAAAQTI